MSFNALNFFFAQVDLAWLIVVPVLCIAAAGCGGWLVTPFVLNKKIGKAKNVAQSIVDEAKIEAKTLKKEAILEAKEEVLKLKQDFDKESKERRNEIQKQEFSNPTRRAGGYHRECAAVFNAFNKLVSLFHYCKVGGKIGIENLIETETA